MAVAEVSELCSVVSAVDSAFDSGNGSDLAEVVVGDDPVLVGASVEDETLDWVSVVELVALVGGGGGGGSRRGWLCLRYQ